MPPFLHPRVFGTELVYTIVILILCFLVYLKTKEIYDLTKHKGIQFFRYAFLFFGLAYASRLFLYLIIIGNSQLSRFLIHRRTIMPLFNLLVAYFSTMAILNLMYSTIWKKINSEHFLTFSNIIALVIAVIAFVSKSPMIVSIIQLALLLITIIISTKTHNKKTKNISTTRKLYLLISLFWLINLFVLSPKSFLPFELKVFFQLISVLVFITIYHKVTKLIK